MRFFTVCVLFLIVQSIFAQNQAPVVSNVGFYERTGGSFFVDIYYDLYDAENDTMQVSISVSSNEGLTWDFPADSVWGDVGEGVTSATGKHIIWNFGAEHKQFYSDSIQIKIIAYTLSCPGIPTVTYADKTYNTVQIGTQCWLKENLDVGTMIQGSNNQTNNGTIEKYCYENDPNNCTTYGGLYQWSEAMAYNTTEGSQGICPTGWHIPTFAEFQTLRNTVGRYGGSALKATGTNTSGFSALFGGIRWDGGGTFSSLGTDAYFWGSSIEGILGAWGMGLEDDNDSIWEVDGARLQGYSIRCLMD